jgi:trk system potassium uptake protein TrkA
LADSRRRAATPERLAATDSVVVIGLGRFGSSLALELEAAGTEVLGIDADEEIVQSMAGRLTHVVRADSTNEEALRQLAVPEFERAVVGIGTNIEASLLTTSLLKGFGTKIVWAKAISEAHARILEQLRVDHVVSPEHEMGRRVAHLVRGRMLDFLEFDEGFAMVRTSAPAFLIGTPLGETKVRDKHGITVVAVKRPGAEFTYATPQTVLQDGDSVIVSGATEVVERFSELT